MCRLKNLVYYIPFQEKERKRTKKGRKGRPQCTLALLKDESAKIEWQTICNPKIAYSLGGLVAIFPAPYDHQGRHASQNKLHGGAEENPAAATCGLCCCLESCYLKTWRFRRMVSNYFDQATILVLDRHFLQEERKEHVCVTSICFQKGQGVTVSSRFAFPYLFLPHSLTSLRSLDTLKPSNA